MTFAIDLFEECKHVYLHFLLLYIFCCVTLGEPLENFTRILFCIIFFIFGLRFTGFALHFVAATFFSLTKCN